MKYCDVLIIGAGPSGAIAGANLVQKGFTVQIIEKLTFPRFVIGESLLPQCNAILAKNNLLETIEKENYMLKAGAIFENEEGEKETYHFRNNLGEPYNTSFQVKRESFDNALLEGAKALGVKVKHEEEVISYLQEKNQIISQDKQGNKTHYQAKFVLDASGYGRVLPRLLDLEIPSTFKIRNAFFTRVSNDIRPQGEEAGYISIFIHDQNKAWIWVIPFSDGTTSVGIVCEESYFHASTLSEEAFFDKILSTNTQAKKRFKDAKKLQSVQRILGYSSNVKTMHGKGFALAGNATEFLDPVFSSGVTLALVSGDLAGDLIAKELQGETIDWQRDYEEKMLQGIDVFRNFILAWYDGRLQKMFFATTKQEKIIQSINSILSGYVWNNKNIFVKDTENKINFILERINSMLKEK
ncbi:MAG: NAD(P)/FAD-dependent oxidoreductase [Sulfurovum sp.]